MTEIEIYKQIVQKQDEYVKYLKGYLTAFQLCKIPNMVFEKEIYLLKQQLAEATEPIKELAEIKEKRNCDNCNDENTFYQDLPCRKCDAYDKWEPKTE